MKRALGIFNGFMFIFLWYKQDYTISLAYGYRSVWESIVVAG